LGIYKLSFKNFKRRKLRSALTMLGIVIGVTTLILLLGFSTGAKTYMIDQTESMMGDIVITNSSSVAFMGSVSGDAYLDKNAVSKIKNMSQLYNFKEDTQFTSTINGVPVMIAGTNNWDPIKDQFKINGTQGVVISKYLVNKFGYKIGSKIKIKDKEFTVTGIIDMSEVTNMGEVGMIYLDIDKALPLNNNKVMSITASVKGDPKAAKKEVENNINGTSAYTSSDFTKQIEDMMNGQMLFIGAIASIGLLVGIISIINIMLVNVAERTREIGVLKAIGFKNRSILGSILTEAGLLGFIGAIVGIIIAAILMEIGIVYFFSQQPGMESFSLANMLPLWLVAGVIGGAVILSVLAGLYPAWRASRLNVVEALRYE
jgi:putative ABC transport system permease protein